VPRFTNANNRKTPAQQLRRRTATSASSDGGTRGTPSAEDIAACSGKAAGDACTDIYDGGDPGTCQLAADGTTLACSEQHGDGGHPCGP